MTSLQFWGAPGADLDCPAPNTIVCDGITGPNICSEAQEFASHSLTARSNSSQNQQWNPYHKGTVPLGRSAARPHFPACFGPFRLFALAIRRCFNNCIKEAPERLASAACPSLTQSVNCCSCDRPFRRPSRAAAVANGRLIWTVRRRSLRRDLERFVMVMKGRLAGRVGRPRSHGSDGLLDRLRPPERAVRGLVRRAASAGSAKVAGRASADPYKMVGGGPNPAETDPNNLPERASSGRPVTESLSLERNVRVQVKRRPRPARLGAVRRPTGRGAWRGRGRRAGGPSNWPAPCRD